VDFSHIETLFIIFTGILDWEHYKSSLIFPQDKRKEKLLKEFLNKVASSEITDIDSLIDLEQTIDHFIENIEVEL
jgi:hypothetical protein